MVSTDSFYLKANHHGLLIHLDFFPFCLKIVGYSTNVSCSCRVCVCVCACVRVWCVLYDLCYNISQVYTFSASSFLCWGKTSHDSMLCLKAYQQRLFCRTEESADTFINDCPCGPTSVSSLCLLSLSYRDVYTHIDICTYTYMHKN